MGVITNLSLHQLKYLGILKGSCVFVGAPLSLSSQYHNSKAIYKIIS